MVFIKFFLLEMKEIIEPFLLSKVGGYLEISGYPDPMSKTNKFRISGPGISGYPAFFQIRIFGSANLKLQ